MSNQYNSNQRPSYGIAVDFGSTTIVMNALSQTGDIFSSVSFPNPQIAYGADVITRVKKCMESDSLRNTFQKDGESIIKKGVQKMNLSWENIQTIVISANSIMQHFFQGYAIDGFATSPFQVVTIQYHENDKYVFPPGFSAFVGADILCGASHLQLGQSEQYDLFIDLGTNGEMLLINQHHGFATSTACGPVFDYAVGGARYGSDCIHAIAQCVQRGLIDRTGKIVDAFFDKGIQIDTNFVIKQNNVRNFQLAKGAILSGIYCLMEQASISEADLCHIYISGGLGFYMQIRDALLLNMFPKSFKNIIHICENTSLQGACDLTKSLLSRDLEADATQYNNLLTKFENMRSKTKSFELSNFASFQDIYLKSLNF